MIRIHPSIYSVEATPPENGGAGRRGTAPGRLTAAKAAGPAYGSARPARRLQPRLSLQAFGAWAQADFVGPAPAWVLLGQPAPAARERPQAERFEAQRSAKTRDTYNLN